MFNFSANHLLLLSRTEYRTCAVLLMRDDSTRRVYRLHDFTKCQGRAASARRRESLTDAPLCSMTIKEGEGVHARANSSGVR